MQKVVKSQTITIFNITNENTKQITQTKRTKVKSTFPGSLTKIENIQSDI
jgi:hypothetical protein